MTTEMPQKYWKNLPEADLIHQLIGESKTRVSGMLQEPLRPAKPAPKNKYLETLRDLSATPSCSGPIEGHTLAQHAKAAESCRGCPLWEKSTGTVFGTGPSDARIMIVGEQPGDKEDIAGQPFVGPAGQLLRKAMADAGIDPAATYLTNAVKHFKWVSKDTPRGKIRLHQTPAKGEIEACRPWVLSELKEVAPEILILLGNTAATSLLGKSIPVTKNRGTFQAPHLAKTTILTVHPSYILRFPEGPAKKEEYARLVADLRLAHNQ